MSSQFRYLGFIIQKDREINSDIKHRIQVDWLKWRSATWVLFDCKSFISLLLGQLCYMARNGWL